ncbi:MAG TPA: S9 family peptidase, partial [Blastocatellia bacterium]|nr:S9 family peptidase [Blastocatellia bacterium]
MTEKKAAPFGSWKSPITSDLIVAGTISLGDIAVDGLDIYWIESRPAEKGRSVIVRQAPDGKREDAIPRDFNARTTVHEYGGGSYIVDRGTVYFSNFADQRIYRQTAGSAEPHPVTLSERTYYADGVIDRGRNRIITVREDHTAPGRDAINTIASVNLEGDTSGAVLVSGNDFYSSPRLSPDGKRLAWLTWNHPNMPWDGCELWVSDVDGDGLPARPQKVAGGENESVFQPQWSPAGELHFVSDRTGWWNLYRLRGNRVEPLCEMEAEFGAPQWAFRMSTYAFESESRIICCYCQQGNWRLASLDTSTRKLEPIETPYSDITNLRVSPGRVLFCGGSPSEPQSIVQLDLATGKTEVLRRSSNVEVAPDYRSVPRALEFPTG